MKVRLALVLAAWLPSLGGAQSTNWISQFGTPEVETGTKVVAGGQGGALVGLSSGAAIFGSTRVILAGYDGAGQQVWMQSLESLGRDEVWGAASDGAGGILVCGSSSGDLGGPLVGEFDGWLGRFDAAGNQLWLTQFGSVAFDACFAVVADGAGGAFACGSTQGDLAGAAGSQSDAWLARFDPAGAVSWIRQLDSGFFDTATGLAVDGAGGVYVSGNTSGDLFGFINGGSDPWVARYDAAGNLLWGRQWGSVSEESVTLVAGNGASGVFVSGNTAGVVGALSAGGNDVWLIRFDELGNQSWVRQFGSSENDSCAGIASDLAGGLYLVGSTSGVLGASSGGGLDAWVARFDGLGEQSWIRQIGSAGVDRGSGLAVARPGQLLLGGSTTLALAGTSAGQEDGWVASLDSLLRESYCSTALNSTGAPASIQAVGSSAVSLNRLELRCESLPRFVFGYLIVSRMQGFTANPGGSQGNLCVGGAVGRFVGPGQVQNSGSSGAIQLAVDLTALPQPLGPVAAQAGETWNFQAWFRDANPLVTSNFSDGIAITLY